MAIMVQLSIFLLNYLISLEDLINITGEMSQANLAWKLLELWTRSNVATSC